MSPRAAAARRGRRALSRGFELEAGARAGAALPPSSPGALQFWHRLGEGACPAPVSSPSSPRVVPPRLHVRGVPEGPRPMAPRGAAVARSVRSRLPSVPSVSALRVRVGMVVTSTLCRVSLLLRSYLKNTHRRRCSALEVSCPGS